MAKTNTTNAATVTAAQRRQHAIKLRKAGHSYTTIGTELHVSRARAYQLVHEALAELTAEQTADAQVVRVLEDARLDTLLAAVWPAALNGHLGAVARAQALGESRRKLWGLDAPSKQEVTGKDGGAIVVARPPGLATLTLDELTTLETLLAKTTQPGGA